MSNVGDTWGFYDKEGRECRSCGAYFPYANFHRHSGCPNGYNTVCKDCRKISSKATYSNQTEEYKMLHRCKSRAKLKNLPFDLEEGDFNIPVYCPILQELLIQGDPDWAASVDRLVPSKGYVKGNIQIISNKANRIKSNASLHELEALVDYLKGELP